MIYIKLKNEKIIYNSLTLDKMKLNHPLFSKKYLALHRIIANTLENELKNFPEIHIVISDKKQNRVMGRFCGNKYSEHKEYNFIPQCTGSPYIVLFFNSILELHYRHKVKGFKETLFHEFYHFKQWLENAPMGHNSILKALDTPKDLNRNLKVITEALNKKGI